MAHSPGRAEPCREDCQSSCPVQARDAIHQHIVHPFGKLIGIIERGAVAHGCGIEDHDVSPHALLENAAISQSHALSRQRGELADGIFERQSFFFANIFAEDAGKGSVGARMRMCLAENAFGRGAFGVVVDGDPRLLEGQRSRRAATWRRPQRRWMGRRSEKSKRASIGSLFQSLAISERRLPCSARNLGLSTAPIMTASGPGISCHSLSQSFDGVSMSLRMRARVAGSFRRSTIFAVPPSWAQGGMKAEKSLYHAV